MAAANLIIGTISRLSPASFIFAVYPLFTATPIL